MKKIIGVLFLGSIILTGCKESNNTSNILVTDKRSTIIKEELFERIDLVDRIDKNEKSMAKRVINVENSVYDIVKMVDDGSYAENFEAFDKFATEVMEESFDIMHTIGKDLSEEELNRAFEDSIYRKKVFTDEENRYFKKAFDSASTVYAAMETIKLMEITQ